MSYKYDTSRESNPEGLKKSYFTSEGIRYRVLRRKENDRWEALGLDKDKNNYYRAYIYTVEQALERGIEFRKDWRNPPKNKKELIFGPNVIAHKDDWVVTEFPGPLDEYWVMQVLWRNTYHQFSYIRTATGAYPVNYDPQKRPFDGADIRGQYSIGGNEAYQVRNAIMTKREQLLVQFIVELITEHGYFSKDIVYLAYRSAYKNTPTWQKVILIMRSEKIMGAVAKQLKELLKNKGIDTDWVLDQLKDMGENDYDKAPDRRLEVVKLVGLMNDLPLADNRNNQLPPPADNDVLMVEDAEVENDLKKIEG